MPDKVLAELDAILEAAEREAEKIYGKYCETVLHAGAWEREEIRIGLI